MVTVEKGMENSLVFTLNESTTSNEFSFKFIHDQTKEEKTFILPELISNARFNLFKLIETTDEDLDNGHVNLKNGFHSYIIYSENKVIETGKVLVKGDEDVNSVYL
jgi:hypothetical protein